MHLQQTSFDWNYHAEKSDKHSKGTKNGSFWPRGKLLGGCSSLNAMLYIRGNSRDYNHWEELGNTGWGYDDVLPYFKKSEDCKVDYLVYQDEGKYHAENGPLKIGKYKSIEAIKIIVYEAAFELGYEEILDVNGEKNIGFNSALGNLYKGERWSTAKGYLIPAKKRPNLHIIKNAHVTKLDINQNGEIEGVKFTINHAKELTATAKKEVILSAGAVNTPQLLLLSGVGPEAELKKHNINVIRDLPVGENLQDHVIVPYIMGFHRSTAKELTIQELADAVYMYSQHNMGPLAALGATDLVAFLNTNSTDAQFPDIQLHMFFFRKNEQFTEEVLKKLGYTDDIIQSIVKANENQELVTLFITLLNPGSRGSIQLRSSNPFDSPKINANYLDDQEDVNTIVRGIRLMQKFMNTEIFKDHEAEEVKVQIDGCSKLAYDSDEYWECYTRYLSTTLYHPVGTTKMGPSSDPLAVVNPQLKVNGIQGLRVIDAGVMPKIPSGNTNAPTIMIAEKAADLIKEEWNDVKSGHLTDEL